MLKGSCLCGAVQYEILRTPDRISHCHCSMCRKQHGAAFATYASLPKKDFRYTQGEHNLSAYNSSNSVLRIFCRTCGSSIEWCDLDKNPEWTAIAVGTLDSEFKPEGAIENIFFDSKACWLD